MRKSLFTLALLSSAFTLPLIAHADTIDQFIFSFVTPPGYVSANLIIDLPASPPVSPWNGFGLCVNDCFAVVGEANSKSYIFNFFPSGPDSTFLQWTIFDPEFGGPPTVPMAYTMILAPTLFTGPISEPTFLTGTFDANYTPFPGAPTFPGTVTIEPVDTTVPEPSSLILFTTGALGLAAFAFRRKKAFSS